ncbi:MAG: hypothetical protein J6R47_04190 [Acholeplasmatales bacterium]|nr:hypothetical protein [Acholeplasmatales bacterium]
MSAYDFETEFRIIDKEYPTRPDWSYPGANTIYDENQSVKWNKEKVLEEQKRWIEERRVLELTKKIAIDTVESKLFDYIQEQIDISREASKRMWERAAWDFNKLESLIDDYSYIKEVDN